MTFRQRFVDAPADIASLAVFRILFGSLMAASMIRFLALGWVDDFYVVPTYHFTWELFPWVAPLPGPLMHTIFVVLALLGCGIALGWYYRACAALFFLGFTYVELIDKTTYLNHYYLVTLLSALLVVLPAHRAWSVDARRSRPLAADTVPAWTINLLRFQIAVVYVFAGLAKLNADWMFDAQPLRMWLAARSDLPLIGPFLTHFWVALAFSWFGAAYDLTVPLFLLRRRTQPLAYLTVVVFHVMTALLFPIGIFPWLMIVVTTVFLPPDWPRRWLGHGGAARSVVDAPRRATTATVTMLGLYTAIQIALPLRAYWPGIDPDWTGRGFNFAWRVMLIEKAGDTEFIVLDRLTGRQWRVASRDYVTARQDKIMAQDPFMVRSLARHIGATLRSQGMSSVEVRADSVASLNGRAAQRLVDPTVDLAGPTSSPWILPLRRQRQPSPVAEMLHR